MTDQVARSGDLVIMKSTEWVKQFDIRTQENPLYLQFVQMYRTFFTDGCADFPDYEDRIPTAASLGASLEFVDKKTQPKNTTYGGRTEFYVLVFVGAATPKLDTGAPVAFITAQHYISYERWKAKRPPRKADAMPELVYIAHFGKNMNVPGAGRILLDGLQASAWKDCLLLLEVENGLKDAGRLINYYVSRGFDRCDELGGGCWEFFMKEAVQRDFLNVQLRNSRELMVLFDKQKELVCVKDPTKAVTWMLKSKISR